ncbi:hypothetical protein [Cedecea colo]|uniref:Phage protein n=1 Tax=Cedecea colo TaxID=2552946 RepID=A0ABX0VL51_9ENTR|nr:hypothetical protein [Cedecea colo]NIY47296.1 hypothetical protein [Cedecea colo]
MTNETLKLDEERAKFEAWFKREIIETEDFQFNAFNEEENEYTVGEDDNEDLYLNIQAMFMAWTASRAALVVELPKPMLSQGETDANHDYMAMGFGMCLGICKRKVLAAGITVKGEEQ